MSSNGMLTHLSVYDEPSNMKLAAPIVLEKRVTTSPQVTGKYKQKYKQKSPLPSVAGVSFLQQHSGSCFLAMIATVIVAIVAHHFYHHR